MNANMRTSACDPQQLESFLSGEMNDAQERKFTLHLNACESCRSALAEQAAPPEAWQEAEMLLKPSVFDAESGDEDGEPGLATQSSRQPLPIQNVLDALGPTDDPEMLGRLGGYEVSGVVGAGGMGVVLKATDQSLDRTVAIKVMTPHLASSGAARRRFAREAKAAAAVLHPNVIAIHSVSNDEALPYLVMPYVRGTSLQKRLDREGPLSLQEILRIGAQIAAGLAAAHAQGLVHRDIKPANILLEEGIERVTITDFGLARAVDDATITHSGMIAGTPQYMSPEQARGEAVDARSDLFSLGSVLYAIGTGRPPFRAETSYGVMRRITDDEPRPIREINPDIPQWLCQLIGKLMSKQAADRYQSAAEVAQLLEACLAHVQEPMVAKLPLALQPAAGGSRFFSISRRSSGVLAMIAAFSLGLLGLVAWQATEAPDIGGNWSGDEWGQVALKKTGDGEYSGTYTDTFKESPGTIEVQWSRLERRYKGEWREGQERSGKISLRLMGDEIRGAWTTSQKSQINPGTPELADLIWKRSSGTSPSTPAATPATEIQLRFTAPQKMQVAVADQQGSFSKSPTFVAPARLNLVAGKTYRLKLTNIAGREAAEFYPTVETGPATPRTEAFVDHNSIYVEFTEEDFDQALAGNFVTKVIYLPDPEFQELALGGVETIVSTRLDPGKDPITEADRRGSILAVIRLGNRDIELPDGAIVTLGGVETDAAKAPRQAAELVPKEPRLFYVAASVASRIEKLKDSYPHLAKFSAAENLKKKTVREGSRRPETYSIDYQHGVKPTLESGANESKKATYDPETGVQLHLYFFPSQGLVADAYPPIQVGDVSVRVFVQGPAADSIRDEIVRILKEIEPLPKKLWATKERVAAIEALLKDAPGTTNYLAELFEQTPGTKGEYRLREDVVTIPIVPAEKSRLGFIALGKVYYLPASKGFYIQWDDIAASTLHYYGPFYGRRLDTLGLAKDPAGEKEGASEPAPRGRQNDVLDPDRRR